MGRRSGYEYCYRFWKDDKIIPQYSTCLRLCRTDGLKSYLFEIRTNFKLKRVDVDDDGFAGQMMGSERFGAGVCEDQDEWHLEDQTTFRLKDYWMSDDEIQSLRRDALNFAKQMAGDTQHASLSEIPVVVGLDVCTLQQVGEPIIDTIDRAIKPESLIPLDLWPVGPNRGQQFNYKFYMNRQGFLWKLDRIRVEDDAGLALMEACPICLRNFVIGAQISFLPCNHACHSLCVFKMLYKEKSDSCPLCGFRIPEDFEEL